MRPTFEFARHRPAPGSMRDSSSPPATTPQPDRVFDAIICFDVFEHLTEPLAAARSLVNHLRPGESLSNRASSTMLDTARVISMSTSRTSAGIAGTHSSPHSDEGIGRDAFPEANGRRTSSATSTVSGLARNRIVVGRRKEGELSGPEVAVVIPTRNRLEYLQPAVRSVVRQSVHELECLVVDDCSDDGTRQWLESVDDPRIRPIFLDRSRERSAARTLGSPLLVRPSTPFLDDDDLLARDGLEAGLSTARRFDGSNDCRSSGRVR